METRVKEGRAALAITILLVATLTVPVVLWGAASSEAQQGQPSPSGTAPAIQLLNPSDYYTFSTSTPGPQMSDKDTEDTDTALEYHFTAVMSNVPANPYVEFFLVQGNQQFNLGCASGSSPGAGCLGRFTPAGGVELVRDIPDVFNEGPTSNQDPTPTGGAVVRAILYANAGQNEIARDDQPVMLNQRDRSGSDPLSRPAAVDPETAAETVEILYPEHGRTFGFFKPGGTGAGIGVVDVEWSTGTDAVQVFYTVSPPDVDPTWKSCSSSETTTASTTAANARDGVRCTLTDGDQPESVTGIAAVARDSESETPGGATSALANNSGDAHRVLGYTQRPGIVSVTSQTLPAGRVPGCSDLLIAQVFDDSADARPIAGVDVDVHAQGPTDNLAFNTHGTEQSQFDQNAPDRSSAPQNHPTENGRRCSDNTPSGTQGNHAVGGGDDRKHVEAADDTDDDGRFTFRLWSDAQGGTTVTAWADTTDDDRFCPNEVAGSGAVTWGSGDPAPPAEQPEPQPCPSPSPSPSASSASTSASASSPSASSPSGTSPSTSPSRSPSASASSPSVSPSQTPSGTPTTTGTGPGGGTTTVQQAEREVTLEASRSRVTFSKTFALSGSVTSDNPACVSGASVRILRDVIGGAEEFELFAQEQADGDGTFSLNVQADMSANYVAQVEETDTCGEASSSPQPVLVRVKVTLTVSDGKVRPGQRVRLGIRTAPCPETARDKVLLFRAIEGQFGKVGKKTSSGACRATFTRRVRNTTVFQGRWPKQAPEYVAGKSRSKAVRVSD